MNKLFKKTFGRERITLVALDQGLEHGPSDFNAGNLDPREIIGALSPHADAFMLNKGTARLARAGNKLKCPLVLKLSGKTALAPRQVQAQIASIADARALRARAVAETVYVGSAAEKEMLERLGAAQSQARRAGLPLMGILYPRGPKIANPFDARVVSYAVRVGVEVGVDFIKTYWTGSKESFKSVVETACGIPIIVAGGKKTAPRAFLKQVRDCVDAGASGVAVGRNVWQYRAPEKMLRAVNAVVHDGAGAREALKKLG